MGKVGQGRASRGRRRVNNKWCLGRREEVKEVSLHAILLRYT